MAAPSLPRNQDMTNQVTILTHALEASPRSVELMIALGNALLAARRPDDALPIFQKAVELRGRDGAALRGLAQTQLDLDLRADALESFRLVSAIIPYDRYAAHMVQALSGNFGGVGSYVPDLFDTYAQTFDEHLTGALQYRIPAIIRDWLNGSSTPRPLGVALDLGCGTGLVAAALDGMVSAIDGIDISIQMTRKAAERGIYRTLKTGDLVNVLTGSPELAGPYDLVIAADVFVYVGQLDPVFVAIAERLESGGTFMFSVEDLAGEGFAVRSSGRFSHSVGYVHDLAAQHGFSRIERQQVAIRQDRDMPIPGSLYLMVRS